MGHLSRCIQLAQKLDQYGVTSHFLVKNNNIASEYVQNSGFQLTALPTSSNDKKELVTIIRLHKKINFNCIFIDLRKTKSVSFFHTINKICKSVVIDNIHKNSFNADLIIWAWSDLKNTKSIPPALSKKIMIGPNYIILRNSEKKESIKRSNSILVSMGGSDKGGFTLKIIDTFKKTKKNFHMDIVLGMFFKDLKKVVDKVGKDKRFTIIQNNDELLSIMRRSKVGIFTFGITTYEALFAGLPSIVISHSKQNDIYARLLSSKGAIRYLGYYKNVNFENIPYLTFQLLKNSQLCKNYSSRAKSLVDGEGSERVARRIVELIDN